MVITVYVLWSFCPSVHEVCGCISRLAVLGNYATLRSFINLIYYATCRDKLSFGQQIIQGSNMSHSGLRMGPKLSRDSNDARRMTPNRLGAAEKSVDELDSPF
jgi:hypothetical protein